VLNNGKLRPLGARELSVLEAALPALVALVAGDISMARAASADSLAARAVDAPAALPGEATDTWPPTPRSHRVLPKKTDAVIVAFVVVAQTANAAAALPVEATVRT
jgi:hypothetical protein